LCFEISIVSEAFQPAATSTLGNISSLSSELLEQLKAQLPESLFAAVSGKLNAYANELEYSKLKIQVLEEKLCLQRIAKYGPGSEKLSNLQPELLDVKPAECFVQVTKREKRACKKCEEQGVSSALAGQIHSIVIESVDNLVWSMRASAESSHASRNSTSSSSASSTSHSSSTLGDSRNTP
jgi:hypothetical protein